MDDLLDELNHVEPAARIVWKDEAGELSSIGAALKQVETQVKLDKNDQFVKTLGDFHKDAKAEFEQISTTKEKADKACTDMLKWLGEDAKVTHTRLPHIPHRAYSPIWPTVAERSLAGPPIWPAVAELSLAGPPIWPAVAERSLAGPPSMYGRYSRRRCFQRSTTFL